ncbi:DJ-1/PfpI family protein [Streptomyces sp. MMS24-I2-30]|uniref:DJ-1/PfpI family protein n=1 Tax=Streptomyces sp. MMS24-I2-30 TaxID=3351564 RepID=UPI003896CF88
MQIRRLTELGIPLARIPDVEAGAAFHARAGLLDGRRAATHWSYRDRLAREYPDIAVCPDPIFTRGGNVWTSAGITAGIDLALAMVEEDHGAKIARAVARWFVVFLQGPGGQAQFSTQLAAQRPSRQPIRQTQNGSPTIWPTS